MQTCQYKLNNEQDSEVGCSSRTDNLLHEDYIWTIEILQIFLQSLLNSSVTNVENFFLR